MTFKINKDSDNYSGVADIVASIFGFGASILVGSFCDSMIATKRDASGFTKFALGLGKMGLETITMFSVSSKMREEIDETVDSINVFSEFINGYLEAKKEAESTKREVAVVDYDEVSNG